MMHGSASSAKVPSLAGQDAFGAIQEVVRILDADPKTDWSRVDIAGLREHLIDMNEVTLHAAATEKRLDNGVEIWFRARAARFSPSSAWFSRTLASLTGCEAGPQRRRICPTG